MPQQRSPRPSIDNYEVSPDLVAEALIRRITDLPAERANYRDALIHSVEVLETPELDCMAIRAEKLQQRLF
jgi:hypothetical protein